jgi:hypothetical protein
MKNPQNCRCNAVLLILAFSITWNQPIHAFLPSRAYLTVKRPAPDQLKNWHLQVLHAHEHRVALLSDAQQEGDHENRPDDDESKTPSLQSRRSLIQAMILGTAAFPLAAGAGKSELDASGQLFSPKSEMVRGGSDAARGIPQESRPARLQPGQTVQTVYETRFLAYLTRFLLTFDNVAHAWWVKQGFQDSWDQELLTEADRSLEEARFAEFAESVEVGLADYFTGPYGSYSSVAAAKAGLYAAAPAKAASAPSEGLKGVFKRAMPKDKKPATGITESSKQGILNLYSLLKARYTSVAAKRQMAILFSFISSPELQPTDEICALLGEADNATITKIVLERPPPVANEPESRTSSRRGGGYSINAPPIINVDPPPALGDDFPRPVVVPELKPTSRILRINVLDGGMGYKTPPVVKVRQRGFAVNCEACAILDRQGHVESIVVLDPGYGYGLRNGALPEVVIEATKDTRKLARPDKKRSKQDFRPASAVAELEYEITGINLLDGGDGYSGAELPLISISPPEQDPDWYFSPDEFFGAKPTEKNALKARVVEMKMKDGSLVTEPLSSSQIDASLVNRLKREPLELLPTTVRPLLRPTSGKQIFVIPSLPPVPPQVVVPSARYRAIDPIFGGIGSVPVTMGALELSGSEYGRLALSGAICTILVRTLLNPLELVKTKIQLKNDEELNQFVYDLARKNAKKASTDSGPTGGMRRIGIPLEPASNGSAAVAVQERDIAVLTMDETTTATAETSLGTTDMISGIVKLRGPFALFQSADITFLASLVFGSFGFGATELFRRSFTEAFFGESGGSDTGSELVLLAAAAVACIITSAAAAPFEVLRVRSMGLVEAKPWKDVLVDFLVSDF